MIELGKGPASAGGIAKGHRVAGPGADQMPTDDGQERDAPGHAPREPARGRLEAGEPQHVPAQPGRVGQGVGDPLAVEQQVGQVVGDQVPDGDRDEARRERADADEASDGEGGQPDERQPADEQERLAADGRRAERVEEGLRLGQAVIEDPGDREGDEGQAREIPLHVEESGREPTDREPPRALDRGVSRQRQRRQPTQEPEPDREDLAVPPPGVPPVLGHRDEGQDRVADHDQPEGLPAPRRGDRQLQPDEAGQADRGRPPSETDRVRRRPTARQPDRAESRGQEPMERAERVEVLPDGTDEGAGHGQSDPAVDPQEERRDVALGMASHDDGLDHDPDPADEPDRGQARSDGTGHPDRP